MMDAQIQVIERAFMVLEAVSSNEGEPMPLGEIAPRCGLNLSTAARISQTLVQCGYLEQPVRKKGYILGSKLASLTSSKNAHRKLNDLAKPFMAAFSARTGEYIDIAVLAGNQRKIIDRILSTKSIQATNSSQNDTPYKTLSGRFLLSGLTESEQRQFFRTNGPPKDLWPEVDSEYDLCLALAGLRRQTKIFREIDDTSCICLPLLVEGVCKATLSTFLPAYRYKEPLVALIDVELAKIQAGMEAKIKEEGLFMKSTNHEAGSR